MTYRPYRTRTTYTRKPDSMTADEHNEFLAELAAKYPTPIDQSKSEICPGATIASYGDCKTIKEKTAFLRHKLATDLVWASKGVVKIHDLQTESEKSIGDTTDDNGIGFSGFDARGMSYLATWITKATTKTNPKWRKTFATAVDQPKSIRKLHKIMPKYANQLRQIADGTLKA